MNNSAKFFFDHSTMIQIILFAALLTSIGVAEVIFCIDKFPAKWSHSGTNFLFILTALPIQLALTFFVVAISKWAGIKHWGITFLLPHSKYVALFYILSFLLLDFFEYVYHVFVHKTSLFMEVSFSAPYRFGYRCLYNA